VPRAGLTVAAVLAAAADLADREGFDAVTPAAVARDVGVRTPSLYAHVDGAEALRVGVQTLALEEMADVAARAVAGRSGSQALRALADAYRDYARAHPGRYAASRRRVDPGQATTVAAGRRHGELVGAVLGGYRIEGSDAVHAVRLVGSTVHGFVTLEASGGFDHSEPSPDLSWSRVVEALDAALSAWSVTSAHPPVE
jgi:AcrR family transcriptional regulator